MSMGLARCLILAITLFSNPIKAIDKATTRHKQNIYKYGGKAIANVSLNANASLNANLSLNANINQSLGFIDNGLSQNYTFLNKKSSNRKQHVLAISTNKNSHRGSKPAQRNQGLLIDTGKLQVKKKKGKSHEKIESVERAKKQTKCYKSFSWCQSHSKKIRRKIECEKELKQCILTACKKANKCNPSFDECYQKNAESVQRKYKCYTQWKRCAELFCSIKLLSI